MSIIIPTFNRAHSVCEAIDSALNQSYPCEVVVVNHGSTDDTSLKIRDRFGKKITFIERDGDHGPHFAWLDGVIHSTGELVNILFDDDLLEREFIDTLLPMLNSDIGFAFCKARLFTGLNDSIGEAAGLFYKTGVYNSMWNFRRFCRQLVSPTAVLLRRSDCIDALYQGKLPNEQHSYHGVGPDLLITLLCLVRYKRFAYCNEPLVAFRSHEGSITVDASADPEKQRQLQLAYREAKVYAFEQLLISKLRKLWRMKWK